MGSPYFAFLALMDPVFDFLSSFPEVLRPLIEIIGLVQSTGWLAVLGGICSGIALAAVVYGLQERRRTQSATLTIEGVSIDALGIANLRRGLNRTLTIQAADHAALIDGPSITMKWRYTGYCSGANESAFEFSIDAEKIGPFDTVECFAYDLKRDAARQHKIRPVLVGPDGISKKVAVPFLEPLHAGQAFDIELTCHLPNCFDAGTEYYTSTLSFDQEFVDRCSVRLVFAERRPDWVRVYQCGNLERAKLIKALAPRSITESRIEYLDTVTRIAGQSARVYLFRRSSIQSLHTQVSHQSFVSPSS